jgi:hypothetical protein
MAHSYRRSHSSVLRTLSEKQAREKQRDRLAGPVENAAELDKTLDIMSHVESLAAFLTTESGSTSPACHDRLSPLSDFGEPSTHY